MSSPNKKISGQSQKTQRDVAALTQQLDARLKHISKTILPTAPYLLEVQSNYRVGQQQMNDWRRSCPFDAHEEQLQYMTFYPHPPDGTLSRVVGGWDDGKGNFKPREDKSSGTSSPLPGQSAKKKISLLDYKKKASGQSVTETPPPEKEVKVAHKPVDSVSSMEVQSQPKSEKKKDGVHGVKRSADAMTDPTEPKKDVVESSSAPAKKVRTSADVSTSSSKDSSTEEAPTFSLPPLLSLPSLGLPKHSLPSITSPTLPAALTAKITKLRGEENSSRRNNESFDRAAPSENSSERDRSKKTSNDKGQEHKAPMTNGVTASRSLLNGIKTEAKKDEPKTSAPAPMLSGPDRKSLLVKIKIPKTIRKACARILGMTPRPQKLADQRPIKPQSTDDGGRGLTADVKVKVAGKDDQSQRSTSPFPHRKPKTVGESSPAPAITGKRRLPEEGGATPESTSKRHEHPKSLDLSSKPHTPLAPPIISPVLSHQGSASKAHLSTPKRSLKGTAMSRINSSEGDVKTPLGAVQGSTPAATSAPDPVGALKAEHSKFLSLGRTLKHSLPQVVSEINFKNDTPETKQGAAIAVESLLAFILSFVLSDMMNRSRSQSVEATTWRSLFGYIDYVKRVTQSYPVLGGLVHQLEGVCRDTVTLYDNQRESKKMADTRSGKLDPDTTNHLSAADALLKLQGEFHEYRGNVRIAYQAWQVGYSQLSLGRLRRLFPETMSNAAKTPGPGLGKDEFTVEKYMEGPYYLPLGRTTSGIEAVRAGWRILEEWTAKEGVKWEGQMGL